MRDLASVMKREKILHTEIRIFKIFKRGPQPPGHFGETGVDVAISGVPTA